MTDLHVPDLSCGHCKATIEKAIKTLDPDAHISFDMDARNIHVTSGVATGMIVTTLSEAGYPTSQI
jgi:copper chaperone